MPTRTLTILADGEPVPSPPHIRLTGRRTSSLYPYPYFLRLWNAPDSTFHRLQRTKSLQILHEETVLAAGDVVDVTREVVEEGSLLTVTFALGYHFWSTHVSLSVVAGATAADTVRQLLSAAASPFQLLQTPHINPTFSRPQAFFGRLPEAISAVLSATGSRPYLVPSGIALLPADALQTETILDLDSVSGPWIHAKNASPRT